MFRQYARWGRNKSKDTKLVKDDGERGRGRGRQVLRLNRIVLAEANPLEKVVASNKSWRHMSESRLCQAPPAEGRLVCNTKLIKL